MKPDRACSRELKGVLQQPEGRSDRTGSQGGSENQKPSVLWCDCTKTSWESRDFH